MVKIFKKWENIQPLIIQVRITVHCNWRDVAQEADISTGLCHTILTQDNRNASGPSNTFARKLWWSQTATIFHLWRIVGLNWLSWNKTTDYAQRVLLRLAPREHDICTHEWKQCCLCSRSSKHCLLRICLREIRQLTRIFTGGSRTMKNAVWRRKSQIRIMWKWLLRRKYALLIQRCQIDNSWQNIQFLTFHSPIRHLTSTLTDIFLFPKLKTVLKERTFQAVDAIETKSTNGL
jgi:hypothetical protein